MWDEAWLACVVQGEHEIERTRWAFWGGASLGLNRTRPPKDKKDE